jgi:methylglutaconyl-CoA hydratase
VSATTLAIDPRGIARLTLDRAALHNAFDDALIHELTTTLKEIDADARIRILVLAANGASFSAGADLNWMRRMAQATEADNKADALRLAELMRTLNYLGKTTIARVQGSAFGGGVGLIACCDIAIGVPTAQFALTETKLGLVPAVISPYVIDAIGARAARRYFQTAEVIGAADAHALGLLHEIADPDALDGAVERQIALLLKTGPHAARAAKALTQAVSGRDAKAQMGLDNATADLIARLRVSPEGQEGLSAFLDKRKPNWIAP